MVVAPDLFNSTHARGALQRAREALMGPLGMRTLDPAEADYRPNYDNANDSHDWHVAKGRNVGVLLDQTTSETVEHILARS